MITKGIINQAIDYIMEHINEDIQIDDVAEYCHFSKFYFSRMFKNETGESIYAFIKRVKMEQSAFRLKVERSRSITDIGLDYGYSASNYSTSFKQFHKSSPAQFRKGIYDRSLEHPFFHEKVNLVESFEECDKKITIEYIKDQKVIYERRIGNYHDLGCDWCDFIEKYKKYGDENTVLLERTFDDPSITDFDKCLYDVCMTYSGDCSLENVCVIQGGKFAVYHFEGYPYQIYAAYQGVFNVWFPNSEYEIDERYGFDIYREINEETSFMKIDICIPVH